MDTTATTPTAPDGLDALAKALLKRSNGILDSCTFANDAGAITAILAPNAEAAAENGIANIAHTLQDILIDPFNKIAPPGFHISKIQLAHTPIHQSADNAKPPANKLYPAIAQALEDLSGRPVHPDDHLELDLGLDSIAKLQLLIRLNTTVGYRIPLPVLARCYTPRALSEALSNSQPPLPPSPQPELPASSRLIFFWQFLTTSFLRALSTIVATGKENIPEGACIFAPNHQSMLDAFYISSQLDTPRIRNTFFYAVKKHVDGAVTRRFAKGNNIIPMDLNGDLPDSMEILLKALRQGKAVCIFPEGTRSTDGTLGPFRKGFAFLATQTGAPVVPVVINGARHVLPRGSRFPKLGRTVRLSFLPPLTFPADTPLEEACAELRHAIAAHLE